MKVFSPTRPAKRLPVEREHYRATARGAGVAPRLRRPPRAFDAAIVVLALIFVLFAAPQVGGVVGTGFDDLEAKLGEIFPTLQGSKPIDLPSGGTVGGDITAQNMPDYTREPKLRVAGRIPAFALAEGRTVEIVLNSALAATITPDADGSFAATITLRDGPNAIAVALISGRDQIASSSYTVVLDTLAPALAITRPAANATVEAPNIVVEGKGDAGVTITADGRTVLPAPDGSFSDTFAATPGARTITVVARDRAGNETTVKTVITVKAPASTGPLAIGVTLDKSSVKPGTFVLARIFVSSNGVPKADEQVTLSVGVITIGSARTNAQGIANIGFAAPTNEGDAAVVVLASGASGRATLTVAK
ncbi:MAG: DUF4175 domain-containing protein [Chloroflexota bacterium]|nr:DUF4175 domain-containing protein [Chloroflexota bacterium]